MHIRNRNSTVFISVWQTCSEASREIGQYRMFAKPMKTMSFVAYFYLRLKWPSKQQGSWEVLSNPRSLLYNSIITFIKRSPSFLNNNYVPILKELCLPEAYLKYLEAEHGSETGFENRVSLLLLGGSYYHWIKQKSYACCKVEHMVSILIMNRMLFTITITVQVGSYFCI